MSAGALAGIALAVWFVPTLALLVCFRLMRDEPGGPDWWMAALWPALPIVLAASEIRRRLRSSRSR